MALHTRKSLEGEQGHAVYYKPLQAPMARATGTKPLGAQDPRCMFFGPVVKPLSKRIENTSLATTFLSFVG